MQHIYIRRCNVLARICGHVTYSSWGGPVSAEPEAHPRTIRGTSRAMSGPEGRSRALTNRKPADGRPGRTIASRDQTLYPVNQSMWKHAWSTDGHGTGCSLCRPADIVTSPTTSRHVSVRTERRQQHVSGSAASAAGSQRRQRSGQKSLNPDLADLAMTERPSSLFGEPCRAPRTAASSGRTGSTSQPQRERERRLQLERHRRSAVNPATGIRATR